MPRQREQKDERQEATLVGGIALAILGMSYGLWYAVFAEHQALDGIGRSLSAAFRAAAERHSAESGNSLLQYRQAKYAYDRQVDVHGHWIGLAMLLIVLAIAFDQIGLSEKFKLLLACDVATWLSVIPARRLAANMEPWSFAQGRHNRWFSSGDNCARRCGPRLLAPAGCLSFIKPFLQVATRQTWARSGSCAGLPQLDMML